MGFNTQIQSSLKLERAKGDSTFTVTIDGLSTEGLTALSEHLSVVGEVKLDGDKIFITVGSIEETVIAQAMRAAYNQAKLWATTLSDNMKQRYAQRVTK